MGLVQFLRDTERIFLAFARRGLLDWMPDKLYLTLAFRANMGRWPNLKQPESYNEKLQWLKLYGRRPEYTTMVDKYAVKEYVANIIGSEHIIPTLGVWDRFEDIDFDALPERFVLKCTHDSGGLVICRNKAELDVEAARAKINRYLKRNFFRVWREWPYKNVPPRIIAEKYVDAGDGKALRDYKIFCFNAEPKMVYVSEGLENHATASISFLTLDWEFAPYGRSDYKGFEALPEKPTRFEEMLQIARKLSAGIPFVRVDLYEVDGQIFFSEITFSPCGGYLPFDPPEWDKTIGSWLDLKQ